MIAPKYTAEIAVNRLIKDTRLVDIYSLSIDWKYPHVISDVTYMRTIKMASLTTEDQTNVPDFTEPPTGRLTHLI